MVGLITIGNALGGELGQLRTVMAILDMSVTSTALNLPHISI